MKVLFFIMIISLSGLPVASQLSGVKSIPGDYPDLSAAITDLNNQGPGSGGVTFNVGASQTAPAGGYLITATGTSSNPVMFQGNGFTISATGNAAGTDGIFRLAGSDYVTIRDFILTGDASVEWGVALLKKNSTVPYDGCNYNNLVNLTITLDKTNTASAGIYAAHHTALSTTVLPDISVVTEDLNGYNSIDGCHISDVYNGISFTGLWGLFEGQNYIGVTSGNYISDFGGSSLPAYGIRLEYFSQVFIANNSITWSGSNMADVRGISTDWGMGGAIVTSNMVNMSGDIFAYTLAGISCRYAAADAYIRYNQVTGCQVNATTGGFVGIGIEDNGASGTNYVEGNTVNNNSLSGTGDMFLISTFRNGGIFISANSVYNNVKNGDSGSLFGIRTDNCALLDNNQVYSNSISFNSGTGSSIIYGIYDSTISTYGRMINNHVYDLSIAGATTSASSILHGIYALVQDSIADNHVYNLHFNNTAGGSAIIKGITFENARFMRNRVADLHAFAGTQSMVYGIQAIDGSIFNNLIGNLHARAANGSNAVVGIDINGNGYAALHFNTIYVNDTSSGAGFGSSAISVSSSSHVSMNSNILINKSAPGTTGYTVAYRRSSTLLTTYNIYSNNNLYYAGTPGPRQLVFFDGTNADPTLNDFKNRMSPREDRSVTENTLFVSFDGTAYGFLHIVGSVPSRTESGAGGAYGFTDYDNQVRFGNPRYHGTGMAPDIGADEYEGISVGLIDISAVSFISPFAGCYGVYTNDEPVAIRVRNAGMNDIYLDQRPLTITVNVTGAVTQTFSQTVTYGSIGPDQTLDCHLGYIVMSEPGIYNFNGSVSLTGDNNTSNDTIPQTKRVVRSFADLPDSIDFNDYNGTNLATLFPEWYEASGSPVPGDSSSLWKSQIGLGSAGNVSARVNLHFSGTNEWIVGPKFWVADSAQLEIDLAVTAKDDITTPAVMGSDDALLVMVSNDCGVSWQQVAQFTAADLLTSTLTTKRISVATYGYQRLTVALKATDGTIDDPEDYDLHIDNIVLKSPLGDLGVEGLVTPVIDCNTNGEYVSVAIRNTGNSYVNLDPVHLQLRVDVTGPVTATYLKTLDHYWFTPGQVINFGMDGSSLNMQTPGLYRFKISTYLPGDTNSSNDTLEVIRYVRPLMTLPLPVDFSGYDGQNLVTAFPGWSEGTGEINPAGIESSWSNISGLGDAGNTSAGIYMAGTGLNEWIVSPAILPGEDCELRVSLAVTAHGSLVNSAVMGTDDKISVMVSTNCGASWITARNFTSADALSPVLTGFTIYLGAYTGQRIMVALRAINGAVNDATDYDLHVDNLRLQTLPEVTPVKLMSFAGWREGNTNRLKWSTATELNSRGFGVERSVDGIHFISIAFVNSKAIDGNSSTQLDYGFVDDNPNGSRQYYRLKQYDIDGRYEWSNVILIRHNEPATMVLAGLYPNPVSGILLVEVQSPYRDAVRIVVCDMSGKQVKEKSAVVEKGINTIDLNVYDIPAGMYILKLMSEVKGETATGKFLKQ